MQKEVGRERNNDQPGVGSARVIFLKRGRRPPMQIENLKEKLTINREIVR